MMPVETELAAYMDEPRRRLRLLIVDDQAANIQAIHRVFSADHELFMATNGDQALAVCREQCPDLVLLDIVMEGMDGYETCRQIKADPLIANIPVIFVTAHNDPQQETLGLEVGAVDFISKPINPSVVRARVKTHIQLTLQAQALRKLVFVDALTGAFNRRYFDHCIATEWLRAHRGQTPLGLILIDVDFFKKYNDLYGHQQGDVCLKRVAATLGGTMRRPGDVLTRYGGEEFACLLPNTDLPGAMHVAGMLEQQVRGLGMAHHQSPVAEVVTVSLGVAVKNQHSPATFDELVCMADAQLYRAKNSGRAQVCGHEH